MLRKIPYCKSVQSALRVKFYSDSSTSSNRDDGYWCQVSGFSRFASRRDLELCLGEFKPKLVDPVIDINQYPIGKWACFLPAATNPESVRLQVRDKMNKFVTFPTTGNGDVRTASSHGISSRTVRFRNVHRDIGVDELRYFLDDYKLDESSAAITIIKPRRLPDSKRFLFNSYFVHFATEDEAERVVQEKCSTVLEGYPIQTFWYNC